MESNFVFIAWLPWCLPGTWNSHSSETHMKSNFVFIAWLPWCFSGTWNSHSSETPIKSNFVFIAWLPQCFPGTWNSHTSEMPMKSNLFLLHGYPGVFRDCDCVLLLIFIISQGSCKIFPTIAHICLLWLSIVHVLTISIYCIKEPTILSSQNISRAKLGLGL